MVTIILIVESMGFTMSDFGEIYNDIKDEQILKFQQDILKQQS